MMILGREISRRNFLKAGAVAFSLLLTRYELAEAKKKKKKQQSNSNQGVGVAMSRLRADLPNIAGSPTGTIVIPNTRYVSTNFTLEYDDGSFHTIPADQYRVAWRQGYIVQRTKDYSGATVDWSSILIYPMYWTGRIVSPTSGIGNVTQEQVEFYQENDPESPIDEEGAVNLELMEDLFFSGVLSIGQPIQWTRDITNPTGNVVISGDEDNQRAALNTGVNDNQEKDLGLYTVSVSDPIASTRFRMSSQESTGLSFFNMNTPNGIRLGYGDNTAAPELSDGLGIDSEGTLIRIRTAKTPTATGDTGNEGEWCGDDDFVYRYTSVGWKRAALSTF